MNPEQVTTLNEEEAEIQQLFEHKLQDEKVLKRIERLGLSEQELRQYLDIGLEVIQYSLNQLRKNYKDIHPLSPDQIQEVATDITDHFFHIICGRAAPYTFSSSLRFTPEQAQMLLSLFLRTPLEHAYEISYFSQELSSDQEVAETLGCAVLDTPLQVKRETGGSLCSAREEKLIDALKSNRAFVVTHDDKPLLIGKLYSGKLAVLALETFQTSEGKVVAKNTWLLIDEKAKSHVQNLLWDKKVIDVSELSPGEPLSIVATGNSSLAITEHALTENQENFLTFLSQYAKCLAEGDTDSASTLTQKFLESS